MLLIWQLFIVCYLGHVRTGNILENTKCPPLSNTFRNIMLAVLLIMNIFFIGSIIYSLTHGNDENYIKIYNFIVISDITITSSSLVFMILA